MSALGADALGGSTLVAGDLGGGDLGVAPVPFEDLVFIESESGEDLLGVLEPQLASGQPGGLEAGLRTEDHLKGLLLSFEWGTEFIDTVKGLRADLKALVAWNGGGFGSDDGLNMASIGREHDAWEQARRIDALRATHRINTQSDGRAPEWWVAARTAVAAVTEHPIITLSLVTLLLGIRIMVSIASPA